LILIFANCPIQNMPHIRFRSSDDEEDFLRDSARQRPGASQPAQPDNNWQSRGPVQQAQPEYLDRPFFQSNASRGAHPPMLRSFGFLAT
jgi:hypothetical protein